MEEYCTTAPQRQLWSHTKFHSELCQQFRSYQSAFILGYNSHFQLFKSPSVPTSIHRTRKFWGGDVFIGSDWLKCTWIIDEPIINSNQMSVTASSILLLCCYKLTLPNVMLLSNSICFLFSTDKDCGWRGEYSSCKYPWGNMYPGVLCHDGVLGGKGTDGGNCQVNWVASFWVRDFVMWINRVNSL